MTSAGVAANFDSPAASRVRWRTLLILAAILAIGAALRFHEITKVGLWPDEFWSSVHLATGRGTAIFDLPTGVLIDPPPQTLLDGAPAWWHVWTGLRGITHPPLYLIFLRWWMDLFRTGDLATRTFSALASLAGVVVLFDILRRTVSVPAGLLAAALMAFSTMQINLSQETRPYPFLALVGLLACHTVVRIEQGGPTTGRLFQLGLFVAATALTHYFSFGALLGIVAYVIFRFRGPARRKMLTAIAIAAAVVAIVWGPFFWQQHREFFSQQAWSLEPAGRAVAFVRIRENPSVFLYGRPGGQVGWIAPCAFAYLLPLLWIRRYPQLMLWWFWIIGVMGSILTYDLINSARLLAMVKYTSLAALGLYAVCAVPLPMKTKWRWVVPYMVLGSVIIATVMRIQEGPPEANGDWRGLALAVDGHAGPGEPLVFYPDPFWGSSGMYYLDVSHYAHEHNRPIMLLDSAPDAVVVSQLANFPRIWFIGPNPPKVSRDYFPHWRSGMTQWFPNAGGYVELTSPRPPSHPESPPH
jgi:hypothetical protein